MRRSLAVTALALFATGLFAGSSGAKSSHATAGPKCPIVSVTGYLGGNKTVAGGIAQVNGAIGGMTLDCVILGSSVKIQAKGHTFATAHQFLPGRCSVSGDTITCQLNKPLQREGLSAVGAWQNTFTWKFTPADPTSHDLKYGSCDVPVTVTLVNGNAASFTKNTESVCDFAAGDVLR